MKSLNLALFLTFFFGPIGLFYTSPFSAIFFILVIVLFIGLNPIYLVMFWLTSMFIACIDVYTHNKKFKAENKYEAI